MLGDVGFDPLGFSTTPVGPWFLGSSEPSQGVIGDLEWYREAELIHGRIAQIAVLGFLGPEVRELQILNILSLYPTDCS